MNRGVEPLVTIHTPILARAEQRQWEIAAGQPLRPSVEGMNFVFALNDLSE